MNTTITKSEARKLVDAIRAKAGELAVLIRKLRDSEGWRSLGYATWAECCETEFGYTKQHANRLIKAEQIKLQVEPMGSTQPNDRQARELARLPADQQADCWQDYVEECQQSNQKPTAAGLRALVDVWLADDEPIDLDGNQQVAKPKSKAAWRREMDFPCLKRLPEDQRYAAYKDAQKREGCGGGRPSWKTVEAVVDDYEADNEPIDLDGGEADDEPDDKRPKRGITMAHEAIAVLKRIPKNDAFRARAGEIVGDWLAHLIDVDDRADGDEVPWEALAAPWRDRVTKYGAAVVAARLENLADEIRTQ